jgi:UDP-glucose 4-epimerase
MKTKVLVTGGAGYIGSKIAYDLTDRDYKVYILDNLSTGYKSLINKKAKFFKGSISDFKLVDGILRKNNIKNIIHLAASLDVAESEAQPLKYYKNNVEGTRVLLEAAVKNKIKSFIFSSTCAVYGNSKNKKIKESNSCHPTSYYGKTKHLAELLIKNFSEKFNFSYGILRYFNVVGSDSELRTGLKKDNDQLFNNLTKCYFKKNSFLYIYGKNYKTLDGTGVRDYISVSDLSKIHILTLEKIINEEKSLILNCGYGKGYSVLSIVKFFEKILKKKIKIVYKKKRRGDIEEIYSDNYLLKKTFKIKIFTPISDIINSHLNWVIFKKKLS